MKPIYKSKSRLAPCLQDLNERLKPQNILNEMGQLSEYGITEVQFKVFCQCFSEGVQYTYDRNKCHPAGIVFHDQLTTDDAMEDPLDNKDPLYFDPENDICAYYDPEDKKIHISRSWIMSALTDRDQEYFADHLNTQYPINVLQDTFLVGVEESFHHYQEYGVSRAARRGMVKYDEIYDHTNAMDQVERGALSFVLQAAEDTNIIPKTGRKRIPDRE